jgi:hypothetical protein
MSLLYRVTAAADAPAEPIKLTPREYSLAEQISQGWRNSVIATNLGLTEGTVKVYAFGLGRLVVALAFLAGRFVVAAARRRGRPRGTAAKPTDNISGQCNGDLRTMPERVLSPRAIAENARWDRIFNEKFGDAGYYKKRPAEQRSSLARPISP